MDPSLLADIPSKFLLREVRIKNAKSLAALDNLTALSTLCRCSYQSSRMPRLKKYNRVLQCVPWASAHTRADCQ